MSSPSTIGRYEIRRLLGQGGMGTVYLAWDPQMDREVALKTIRTDGPVAGDTTGARARFLKEARLAGRLLHPHIATVFDVGEADGVLFLAMEYVDGGNLAERLAKAKGPLPVRETLVIAAQVAEALSHAHSRGVIHRDIKPANILFSREDTAKVTDFGIGKLIGADVTTMTATGQMVGSPSYMSPEQIRSEPLDGRSDLFSLGLVLYECLTARKPFSGDSLTGLIYQILTTEPPDLSALRPGIPAEVAALVKRSIAKNAADRFTNASEMAAALRALASAIPDAAGGAISGVNTEETVRLEPTSPTSPVSYTPPTMPARTPRPLASIEVKKRPPVVPLVAGGAALLIIVAGGLFYLLRSRPEKIEPPPAPLPQPAVPSPAPSPLAVIPPSPPVTETPGAIRIVELTPAVPSPAIAAVTPKAAASPSAEMTPAPVRQVSSPTPPAQAPSTEAPGLRVVTRRSVKVGVSPEEASVFLDGRWVGIADDWDDGRGGGLLTFTSPGRHTLRFAYPGKDDLVVEVVVSPSGEDDEVEIEEKLVPGSPRGPLGPSGKFKSPSYKTRGELLFKVEPPTARVLVDGRPAGTAGDFVSTPLKLDAMKAYEISLAADGYETKTLRVVSTPSAGDDRVVVKEKLKPGR